VFHLAAQPLVRLSYADPILTYETNVIGTARVLEAVRKCGSVRAVVSVTTDKCYENKEWLWGYRESDPLGGYDPYSSSKACAELVSAAYRQSYFSGNGVALGTARSGNVIGGGDWSADRLIPDLVRGFQSRQAVPIRRPRAIRPWQHVLEPLHGYITLAERLLGNDSSRYATAYNFGPSEEDARPVEWVADRMVEAWGDGAAWFRDGDAGAHEAGYLKLDASRARAELGWAPKLGLGDVLEWSVRWYRAHRAGEDMAEFTTQQIREYDGLLQKG
jgi:CDP-glucose 4,6-dehydratase